MVSQNEVSIAYRLILGREPENEAAFAAHQAEVSLDTLGRRLLATDEFRRRASTGLYAAENPKWVCAEIRHALKLWVDLSDHGVSAGCLHDDWEPAATDFILSVLGPGDTFIDIGANIGWFSVLAAHVVGAEGRVYAFEPREDLRARLCQSIAANGFDQQCHVESSALGEGEGESYLAWVPGERNPGHSFLAPANLPEGAERLAKVSIRPLDSFNIPAPVRIVKIDVEGAESMVLKGARRLIERDHPILVLEIFPEWLHAVSGTTPNSLLESLRAYGYRVFFLTELGLGRELRSGNDVIGLNGPEYYNVVALSDDDSRRLMANRFDQRVADLERHLKETLRISAEARATAAAAELRAHAEAQAATAARAEIELMLDAANARATAAELQTTTEALAATTARAEARRTAQANVASSRAISQLQAELAVAKEQLGAFEKSTLWQATYPLRQVGSRMPISIRRSVRRAARLFWWTVTFQLPGRLREYAASQAASNADANPAEALPIAESTPQRPENTSLTTFVAESSSEDRAPPCLPAPTRPRVLVIDSRWPRPDRDSGSLDALLQVRALLRMGKEVVFAGDTDYTEDSPYRTRLETEGAICLSPAICPSIESFLHTDGHTLEFCILSRIHSGGRYLEAVRRHAPRAQIIFNTVDLHHVREEREADLNQDMVALRRAEETRSRELYIVRQADATIVVSAVERKVIEDAVPGAMVFEIPLARAVRPAHGIPGYETRHGIGFVGGFEHTPNVDAVEYLLAEIWPRVLLQLPTAQLSIVGAGLPLDVLEDAPDSVRYLGPLSDIDPWLDKLKLTIAPLRYGAGAKGKVASSLAAGVPCVCSPIAAEGMSLADGVDVAVCNTPKDFADRIVEIHQNPVVWAQLSTGAHEKADRELSIEAGDQRLAALLSRLGIGPLESAMRAPQV